VPTIVCGNLVKASDIKIDNMSVYGAYEKVGQLPAGVHYQLEDDGVLPNGATDGGHHDQAAAAMNMHLAIAKPHVIVCLSMLPAG
jgi:hypothetical protein